MKEFPFVLVCVILYGTSAIFKRIGLEYLTPYQFLLATSICYACCIPFWINAIDYDVSFIMMIPRGIICAMIYSLFSVVASVLLANLLRTTQNTGSLFVMINLSSLVTLALSYIFLGEILTTKKIIGIVFGTIGLIIMNL